MPRQPGENRILRDAIGLVVKKARVCRKQRNIRKRVYPKSKSIKVLVDVLEDAENDGIQRDVHHYIQSDWVNEVAMNKATHRLREKYTAMTELLRTRIGQLTGEQSKLEKGKHILGNRWKESFKSMYQAGTGEMGFIMIDQPVLAAEEQEIMSNEDRSEKKLFREGYPDEKSKDIFNLSESSDQRIYIE